MKKIGVIGCVFTCLVLIAFTMGEMANWCSPPIIWGFLLFWLLGGLLAFIECIKLAPSFFNKIMADYKECGRLRLIFCVIVVIFGMWILCGASFGFSWIFFIYVKRMRKENIRSKKVDGIGKNILEGNFKMNTEKKRLIVLRIGIGMVVLAGLFPPLWRGGYGFLFSINRSIDLARLTVEVLIIVLLTAYALYTMKKTDGK